MNKLFIFSLIYLSISSCGNVTISNKKRTNSTSTTSNLNSDTDKIMDPIRTIDCEISDQLKNIHNSNSYFSKSSIGNGIVNLTIRSSLVSSFDLIFIRIANSKTNETFSFERGRDINDADKKKVEKIIEILNKEIKKLKIVCNTNNVNQTLRVPIRLFFD